MGIKERIAALRGDRVAAKEKEEARVAARAAMRRPAAAPKSKASSVKPAVSAADETKAAKAAKVKEA